MNLHFNHPLFRRTIPAAALALLSAFPAHAVLFSFTGEITTINNPHGLLPFKFPPGGAFSGTFSYDPAQAGADTSPGDSSISEYFFTNPDGSDFSLSLTVGANTFASQPSPMFNRSIFVGNDLSPDSVRYRAGSLLLNGASLPNGLNDEDITLDFTDGTGTALSDDSLPTFIPPLSLFGGSAVLSFRAENDTGLVSFDGTILTVTPVPEPGEWAVIAGGLLGVFALARRRRA